MANFQSLEAAFTKAVDSRAMPGIVVTAATDKGVLYERAFGKRDLSREQPMTVDTVVWIASMTKAVTAVAAMQLVEQGKLSLEHPASAVVPELASVKVIEGFDAAGTPSLRPPKRPITLRHLLTHTAGFSYEIWSATIAQYQTATGTPGITTCTNAALTTPLLFDPGDRWDYGINIDWAGKMVEAASGQTLDRYLHEHIFQPLGMRDTSFKLSAEQRSRLAKIHQRDESGALTPVDLEIPQDPEFHMGGGGLYGTAVDYLRFARMLMQGGTLDGARVLGPDTIALMAQNHIGPLEVGPLKTAIPSLSKDVELFPGMSKKWGLSFLINTEDVAGGRSSGSLAWAGLANTYYWVDIKRQVSGVFASQVLPFYDDVAIDLLAQFETAVYQNL